MVSAFCFSLLVSLAQAAIFIVCNAFFAPGAGGGGEVVPYLGPKKGGAPPRVPPLDPPLLTMI